MFGNKPPPRKLDVGLIRRCFYGGESISEHNSPFKVKNFLEKVPNTFSLDVGDKFGIAVFRTFNLEPQEQAYNSANKVWGKKEQKCGIYTGEVRTGPPAVDIQQSQYLTDTGSVKETGRIIVRTETAAKGDVTELCKNKAFCHNINTFHGCSGFRRRQ